MLNFKKIVIASALFAAGTSLAFAEPSYKGDDYKGEEAAPCPVYQFQAGPYLGLSAGPRINFAHVSDLGSSTYAGAEGIISAGIATMINPSFYLAGEIFGGDSVQVQDYRLHQDDAADNDIVDTGVRSSWSYGLDIIPGYMLTDHFLGYLRAGVVRTRFSDQDESATGWQVGLGGQTNIYQNWDVRMEYVFSSYGSVDNDDAVVNTHLNPQGGVFDVGLVYKFV